MKFINFLSKNKTIYILLAINVVIIAVLVNLIGDKEILDTKFFYLKSEIQTIFAALGDEGRATYIKINFIDFTFICAYTLFFIGAYFSFFKDMAKVLILVPIFLAVADLSETGIILYLLKSYPLTYNGAEYFLVLVTPLKWILALSSLLAIVNGYIVNLYMKKT